MVRRNIDSETERGHASQLTQHSTVDSHDDGRAARSNFTTRPVASARSVVTEPFAHYRFTVLTDGIIRYEWAEDGKFEDRASTFVINRDLPMPTFRVVNRGDDGLDIVTSRVRLSYDKKRFSPGGLTAHVTAARNDWHFGQAADNLGGTARTLDKADGRIPLEAGILAKNGFADIDDSGTMLFNGDGWVAQREPGDRIDGYLFAYGNNFRTAVRDFYKISGSTPLLPRWTLGNWWSRYYPYSDKEYLGLMDRFNAEKVPLSVAVVDIDWHLIKDPKVQASGASGWTGYSWNRELFPDPEQFMAEIHKRSLHFSLNDHPAEGIYSYEDAYEDMAKALDHDTTQGDRIPFEITDRKFADAFYDILHRGLEKQGVDFWWCDWQQGRFSLVPGFDPLWLLNHFSYLDNARNGTRPLHFSRYAGPGSHRYPIGFSGDTVVTWESLAFQPEFTATASNVGYGWWSNDIGGHMFGIHDEELTTRWVQLGVFSPILRLHSTDNSFITKEPWDFSVEHEIVQKQFLRLRHKLVPYLYSMNVRATKGEPLIQPMYWSCPERKEAYTVPNQFHFGTGLIVIPITSPADSYTKQGSVAAWLPPGTYVDIFTETIYTGNRRTSFFRPLAQYPVLAHAGAIIPLDGSESADNGCPAITACELLIVVGECGQFELCEDDGRDEKSMKSRTIPIQYNQADGSVTIGATEEIAGLSSSIDWTLRFLACSSPEAVSCTINDKGHSITPQQTARGFKISLGTHPVTSSVTVSIGPNPKLYNSTASIKKQVREAMVKTRVEHDLKQNVWLEINAEDDRRVMAQHVEGYGKELHEVKDMILEILLANV